MTHFKQIVEPLVQQHVQAPATIELRPIAARQLAELRVTMLLAAADGFHEPSVMVDAHDEVLRHGALPLGMLERVIDEWIS